LASRAGGTRTIKNASSGFDVFIGATCQPTSTRESNSKLAIACSYWGINTVSNNRVLVAGCQVEPGLVTNSSVSISAV
jgi:hypothetical protein